MFRTTFRDLSPFCPILEKIAKKKQNDFHFSTYLFTLADVIIYFIIHLLSSYGIIYILYCLFNEDTVQKIGHLQQYKHYIERWSFW